MYSLNDLKVQYCLLTMQTEAYEHVGLILTKTALTIESVKLYNGELHWSQFVSIPALIFGWINSLSVQAIAETLGTTLTNAAIFGNNTCT